MYLTFLKWLSKLIPWIKIPCGEHLTTIPTEFDTKNKSKSDTIK